MRGGCSPRKGRDAGPANRVVQMRPPEKYIWKEAVPKQKKNLEHCGLERKSDSDLWKTKEKKKRHRRMEGTNSVDRRGGKRPHPLPSHGTSGHLSDAPLWTAAIWLFPACSHPVF